MFLPWGARAALKRPYKAACGLLRKGATMATTSIVRSAQAAKAAGISASSLRNYTRNALYRLYFSQDAAPAPGKPRCFSPDDVRLLRFIAECTAQGLPHTDIAAQIASGALAAYDWRPPEGPPGLVQEGALEVETGAGQVSMVLASLCRAAEEDRRRLWERLLDSERARVAAEERARQLQAQIDMLRRPWWARLFGSARQPQAPTSASKSPQDD